MSGQPDGSEYVWVAAAIAVLFAVVWLLTGGCQW